MTQHDSVRYLVLTESAKYHAELHAPDYRNDGRTSIRPWPAEGTAWIEALPIFDRLLSSIEPEPMSGCWIWTRKWCPGGYGIFDGRQAHRVVYEALVGPIAAGLHLDHLCYCRPCVNPGHLEPVPPEVNIGRAHERRTGRMASYRITPEVLYDAIRKLEFFRNRSRSAA